MQIIIIAGNQEEAQVRGELVGRYLNGGDLSPQEMVLAHQAVIDTLKVTFGVSDELIAASPVYRLGVLAGGVSCLVAEDKVAHEILRQNMANALSMIEHSEAAVSLCKQVLVAERDGKSAVKH